MSVILAHDSFTQYGGAERVFEGLHELYPDAPVVTLVVDEKFRDYTKGWKIIPSSLQRWYLIWPHFKHFLLLLPWGTKSLSTRGYDLVISSSSLLLKGLQTDPGAIHINYCHTPVRFIWSEPNYVNQEVPWLLRGIIRSYLKYLKKWDYQAAQKVTHFIANCREVQDRIQKFYGRSSTIIHPFINTQFWHSTKPKGNYFLIAGRLVAHKDNDVVIKVFNELGWPLRVVGTGSDEQRLKRLASNNITFLGRLDDEQLRDEYSGARGFIYPQYEDFGIMPIEAAACGTATLALGKGGSLETVIPGVTGELMPELSHEVLKSYVQQWEESKYSIESMQNHVQQFSKERFQKQILNFVNEVYENRG